MQDFLEALAKLITEFSWKRFFGLLLLVIIVMLGLSLYERFTSSFRLNRLQKEAEILATLQEIEKKGPMADSKLNNTFSQISQELQEASTYRPLTLKFAISATPFWKFIAGASIWLIFSVLTFIDALKTRKHDDWSVCGFTLVLAVIFGMVGVAIPDQRQVWINYILYPVGHVFLMFGVISLLGKKPEQQEPGDGSS